MQKRWTALALAALMLLTASCHRTAEPSGDGSQSPQIGWRPQDTSAQSSASEADPVKPPPAWEEGRTLEDLPDDYNSLELPIQGATGYAPVEMALWADPADRDAAAQAVEDWEKAQEEKKRLEEEQKRLEEEQKRLEEEQAKAEAAAQSQSQAQQGGGETAAPAEPGPSPAGSADQSGAPEEPSEGEAASEEEKEPAAQPEAPAPAEGSSSAGESAPPPGDPDASAQQPPAQPEPPAGTEQPPETAQTPPAPETPEEEEEEPPTLTDGALALLKPGTAFTVLEEQGEWWHIAVTADCFTDEEQTATHTQETTGWVEHKYCFVNLPDVIPSIIYDATNSYSSHFVSCGKDIPEVTGEAFYTSKTYNERLDKMEFMMPVLYSMAHRLCAAQQAALAEGNSLILYEGYRPHTVQTKVLNSLSALARRDPEIKDGVSGKPWSISWFISGGYSNHQRGYAVDVGLAKVLETKEYTTGGCRYVRVWNFERYEMPTPIHELSKAAATYVAPVTINSNTAWKNAEMTQAMASNEPALGLQGYCTGAGLTPLASEWWHFNDLTTRSQVLSNQGIGDFEIVSVRSTAPA